jgi:hypothetical protein
MKYEPLPSQTTALDDTKNELHHDIELRSRINLKKSGLHVYAADPSTEVICLSFAINDGPVQRWFPGDPIPPVWFEAANDPNWTAFAHNAQFEITIGELILHPRFGFRHSRQPVSLHKRLRWRSHCRGTGKAADAGSSSTAKDKAGERLMHKMTKPRKPTGLRSNGLYWHEGARSGVLPYTAGTSRPSVKLARHFRHSRKRSRRCGCSPTRSTSAAFTSTGRS